MSDFDDTPSEEGSADPRLFREPESVRCPNCDSVVQRGDVRCLMCGRAVSQDWFVEAAARAAKDALRRQREANPALRRDKDIARETIEPGVDEVMAADAAAANEINTPEMFAEAEWEDEAATAQPEETAVARPTAERIWRAPEQTPATASAARWRPSPFFVGLVVLAAFISLCGGFGLHNVGADDADLAALPPSPTPTASATASAVPPAATETAAASSTPTITPTPLPTDTPQPPRLHKVETGETIFGISFLYGITVESLYQLNGFNANTLIQAGQEIQIPWPTPTPPLQPIAVTVGEDQIIVDPSTCPPFYTIKEGENLFFLAAQNKVPLDALLQLNYLSLDSVVRPGDIICIPQVIENGILPPTPGPSPTPSQTPPPAGPRLLYPIRDAEIENAADVVALQWLAVKDLAPDEWYMIEVTDITDPDGRPHRAFTRQNSFQVPPTWRGEAAERHQFRWRITIVHVTGRRSDGGFIYTYGGRTSQDGTFYW